MKHGVAGVLPDLLGPVYLDRFVALFNVAARKSLIQWTRTAAGDAQLALLDANSRGEGVPDSMPCVIYVGKTTPATENARNARWVSHLPAEFTVSDLIDALDRAAVFLMDWTARQKVAAAKAMGAGQPATATAGAAASGALAAGAQFQLSAWVSLDAPFNTGACVRALALLTRAPIQMHQLCSHSGLDEVTARALITSLERRGVLRVSQRKADAASESRAAQEQAARARPVRSGLIQRLARWVRGGGRS